MAILRSATAPLRYDPSIEQHEPDEAATTDGIIATMRSVSETTYEDGGHAIRSVHAKSHALLKGRIEVLDGLPDTLAQGLFARPASYPMIMRISTIPGDILDDNVSVPRGMAIKIIGVPGERLAGSEDDTTQDFVLVDAPAFAAPSGKAFLKNLKLLAATTDKAPTAKKIISSAMQGLEKIIETFGGKSPMLIQMGGHPETQPFGETFYSQSPHLYGDYIAKVSVAPVSPELTALTGQPVDLDGKPDGLREAALTFFRQHGGVWELRVQLCTDLKTMPVEDSSVPWPEDESPYVAVARITVEPQEAWSPERSREIDDGLAFSPWHSIAAHRPLGSIMRMRKPAYTMSARFRSERNRCPITEPRAPAM